MIKEIWNTLTSSGKRSLLLSVTGFTLYALSGIAMMYIVLKSLESVMSGNGVLMWYWIALVACLLIKGGSNILADVQKHHAGFDIVFQIRKNIICRLKEFSLGFYTNERLGEISTIIHKDVDKMEMVVGHIWTRMLADFIVSAALLAALVIYSPKMALLMVSALPVAILFLVLGLKRGERLEKEAGNDLADMVSVFVEYVKGIPLLKAFSESRHFEEKVEQTARDFGQSSKAVSRNRAAVLSVYGFLIDVSFWIMLSAGLLLILAGSIPVYGFLLFAIISREFYKPFLALESHWANYLTAADSYRRIKKITEAETVTEPKTPVSPSEYSIDFEDVTFSYEEGGFTMNGISFHTPTQTLTALVGGSGSGKTTITNLLLRFWDVTNGAIRIGGVDVRDMSYDELLGSVSIVMQNVQLFADTIEGNIRLGKAAATQEEIIEAAKKARIHDFILSLPDGYQTMIGENGVGLSGGQKQRVAIARAIATEPRVLLCDEATSALDPNTTESILNLIRDINRTLGITVVMITHQMSVIEAVCDRVAIIDQSRIAEEGEVQRIFSAPQSKIGRELILGGDVRQEEFGASKKIRVTFDGRSAFEPVIANMILGCQLPVNILFAATKEIGGKAAGQMVLQLPENEADAMKLIHYLRDRGVNLEEVKNSEF